MEHIAEDRNMRQLVEWQTEKCKEILSGSACKVLSILFRHGDREFFGAAGCSTALPCLRKHKNLKKAGRRITSEHLQKTSMHPLGKDVWGDQNFSLKDISRRQEPGFRSRIILKVRNCEEKKTGKRAPGIPRSFGKFCGV
jgi:hypothetical protein